MRFAIVVCAVVALILGPLSVVRCFATDHGPLTTDHSPAGARFATDRLSLGREALFPFLLIVAGVALAAWTLVRGVTRLQPGAMRDERRDHQQRDGSAEMHEAMRGAAEELQGTFVSPDAMEAPLVNAQAYCAARRILAKPIGDWSHGEFQLMLLYTGMVMSKAFPQIKFSVVFADEHVFSAGTLTTAEATVAWKEAMNGLNRGHSVAMFHHGPAPVGVG